MAFSLFTAMFSSKKISDATSNTISIEFCSVVAGGINSGDVLLLLMLVLAAAFAIANAIAIGSGAVVVVCVVSAAVVVVDDGVSAGISGDVSINDDIGGGVGVDFVVIGSNANEKT